MKIMASFISKVNNNQFHPITIPHDKYAIKLNAPIITIPIASFKPKT